MQVLLLSGLLCDETVWWGIYPRLADLADVTPLHFAGYDSLTLMAESALAAVPGPVAVVGHSMGARVALEMFRQEPQRIAALALLNTGVHGVRDGEAESRGRLVRLATERGMLALADEWLPPMMGDDPTVTTALMPVLRAMVARNSPEQFAAQIRALLGRQDANNLLPHIAVPTLLMSGTADRWSPLEQHGLMQRSIPGSTLVAVPHGGHMAPVEYPGEVARSLLDWLERVPAGS